MTPLEKVKDFERQIREMIAGKRQSYSCPFCGGDRQVGDLMLCCEEAATMVEAVISQSQFIATKDILNRVMDRVASRN